MAYSVLYKASVESDLKKCNKSTAARLLRKLEQALSANPNIGEPLKGEFQGLLKYRVVDYRAIYTRIPERVLILRISHRREAYR